MLRPRESRDLRLISCNIVVTPAAVTTWAQDVFGNAVATATFKTMADTLLINSVAEVGLTAAAWPVFDIAASAIFYRFRYSDDEWVNLGALTVQQYPDPAGRLLAGHGHSSAPIRRTRFPCSKISARASLDAFRIRSARMRELNRRPRLWIAAGAPAVISRSSSSKRRLFRQPR